MGLELDKIPACRKARKRAEQLADERRDLALSGVPVRLCGLDAYQLTARHLLTLFAARSPFLFGGAIEAAHIAQFLWIVRAGDATDPRGSFARKVARLKYVRSVRAIDAYLEAALMDRPATRGPHRTAITGTFAAIVHRLATAYGWSRDSILDSPLAEIYQYFRLITQDADPKAIFFNPSDKPVRLAYKKWKAKYPERAAKLIAGKKRPLVAPKGGRRG